MWTPVCNRLLPSLGPIDLDLCCVNSLYIVLGHHPLPLLHIVLLLEVKAAHCVCNVLHYGGNTTNTSRATSAATTPSTGVRDSLGCAWTIAVSGATALQHSDAASIPASNWSSIGSRGLNWVWTGCSSPTSSPPSFFERKKASGQVPETVCPSPCLLSPWPRYWRHCCRTPWSLRMANCTGPLTSPV